MQLKLLFIIISLYKQIQKKKKKTRKPWFYLMIYKRILWGKHGLGVIQRIRFCSSKNVWL